MMVWTLRRGGWPRYIATTLAGMYRQVFGLNRVEGPIDHDFRFIPSREPPLLRRRRKLAPAASIKGAPAPAAAAAPDGAAAAAPEGAGGEAGAQGAVQGMGDQVQGAGSGVQHQQLSSVQEEDDISDDFDRDPMASTHQTMVASCAQVPACGTLLGSMDGADGAGGVDGGGARRGEAELIGAAPPVQDARGVLRVAAVALGRTMSYRPSMQLSAVDIGNLSFTMRDREVHEGQGLSAQPSPRHIGEAGQAGSRSDSRNSHHGLTGGGGAGMRTQRSMPMGFGEALVGGGLSGGGGLTKPSRSLVYRGAPVGGVHSNCSPLTLSPRGAVGSGTFSGQQAPVAQRPSAASDRTSMDR